MNELDQLRKNAGLFETRADSDKNAVANKITNDMMAAYNRSDVQDDLSIKQLILMNLRKQLGFKN